MTDTCKAALNIRGEHFPCDYPPPHDGLAHNNRAAQAIWVSDLDPVPGNPARAAVESPDRQVIYGPIRDDPTRPGTWATLGADTAHKHDEHEGFETWDANCSRCAFGLRAAVESPDREEET